MHLQFSPADVSNPSGTPWALKVPDIPRDFCSFQPCACTAFPTSAELWARVTRGMAPSGIRCSSTPQPLNLQLLELEESRVFISERLASLVATSLQPGPVTVSRGGWRRLQVQPWLAKAPRCWPQFRPVTIQPRFILAHSSRWLR